MRLLAIETTGISGTLALAEDGRLIAECELPATQRSAQSLAPSLHQLLAEHGWPPLSVGIVAVIAGPGSFTGLRIGVTTAKTFAYVAKADVIALDTMEVLAAQAEAPPGARIQVTVDAQRKQVFSALFTAHATGLSRIEPTRIVDFDQWLAELKSGDYVNGSAIEKSQVRLPSDVRVAELAEALPRAATVARLAWNSHQSGRRDDLWNLAPLYIRPSAAEEKAARTLE